MPKTSDHTAIARAILIVGSLGVAVFMLAPSLQGAEEHLGLTDKQAHALGFYIFTLVGFLAMPRMRRNDLALTALALGAAAEIAQTITGRDGSVMDFVADACGICAAWAPATIERMRGVARRRDRRSAGARMRRQIRSRPAGAQSPGGALKTQG